MGNFWQDLRETAHRFDPIGANLVDNMIRTDSRVAAEASRGLDRLVGGSDRQTGLGRGIRDESRRNIKDPSRAVGRAAATLALMYGGYVASGYAGGATAAEAGAAGTATSAGGYGAGTFEGYAGTQAAGGSLAAGAGTGTLGGGTASGYGFTSELAAGELLGSAAAGGAADAAVSGGGTQTAATMPSNTATSSPASPYRRAAESIGTGIATNYVTSLLAPKPDTPQVEPVTPMPDPEAQAAARKRKAALRARQGRVSSILTAPGGY